jgi:EmrB/QacA subfamily drug resistance transporter
MQQAQEAAPAGRRQAPRAVLLVFAGLMTAMLMATLDTQVVATALPSVVADLGGIGQFAWVSTGYLLTLSISTLLLGKLGDQFGRKNMLLATIAIFLAGSAACGAAGSMGQLIAFRAIQGSGGGGITVTVFALLGDLFEPRQRARYQGYSMAVFAVSSVTGPLIGGLITDHLGWRWVFYINLPLGALAVAIISRRLAAPTRPRPGGGPLRQVDFPGIATLSAATVCLLLTATWAGTRYAWSSPTVVGLAAAAIALLAVFGLIERRAAEPVIPLHLITDSTVAICTAVAFVAGFVVPGILNYLSLYLQRVSHASPQGAGLLLLPLTAGLLVASITVGQRISKTGQYRWYPAGSMATAAAGVYLLSTMSAATNHLASASFLAVLGLGTGLSQNVVLLAAQASAPLAEIGVATSVITFARTLGTSVGIAIFGAVLNHSLAQSASPAAPSAYADALSKVFRTAIPVLAAGLLVSLFLKNLPLRQRGAPPGAEGASDQA